MITEKTVAFIDVNRVGVLGFMLAERKQGMIRKVVPRGRGRKKITQAF